MNTGKYKFFGHELRAFTRIQFVIISEIRVNAFPYPCSSVFIRG